MNPRLNHRLLFPTVFLSLLMVCCPQAGAGDTPDTTLWAHMKRMVPRGYVCAHADKPIVVDGSLDDADWQTAPWSEPFLDIEGDAQPRPPLRTRMKMLWDDSYLYIAAELEEPHAWATLTKRDSVIFQDPDFEVFIDPDFDSHDYYEFEMNALNTVWDLLLPAPYKDGGAAVDSWDIAGLKSGVRVKGTLNDPRDRDKAWTLEIAFPWTALAGHAHRPTPPAEGDQWRINFSRVEWTVKVDNGRYVKIPGLPEHNWVWSPTGIIDMHRPEKWGAVQFTRKPARQVSYDPDPSLPARDLLHGVYYAQREFLSRKGRWASTLSELKESRFATRPTFEGVDMERTGSGFLLTTTFRDRTGVTRRLHLTQDALVRIENTAPIR